MHRWVEKEEYQTKQKTQTKDVGGEEEEEKAEETEERRITYEPAAERRWKRTISGMKTENQLCRRKLFKWR